MMKLQKFLINAGQLPRRKAIAAIEQGEVQIDGKTVREPFALIDEEHHTITLRGKPLEFRNSPDIVLLLHKPHGFLTAETDPEERPLVKSLFAAKVRERLFPVGRLDFNSEGLLIFTNNGELAQKLSHPRYQIPRTYRAKVHGQILDATLLKIRKGVFVPDLGYFPGARARIERSTGKNTWLQMTIQQGRNREIRKLLEFLRLPVVRLIRISFGPFTIKGLPLGTYRILENQEITRLHSYIRQHSARPQPKRGG